MSWGAVGAVQSTHSLGPVHMPPCCSAPDVEVFLMHRAFSTISLSLLVNELWSVLPSPKGVEDGVADPATSFPSSSHSPRPRVMWKEQDSHSASTVALAGSTLSDTSYR